MYRRKFRAVIFTKRKILKWIFCFFGGAAAAVSMAFVCSEMSCTTGIASDSTDLYMSILENELPVEKSSDGGMERWLGFNIKEPQTILEYCLPVFDSADLSNDSETPKDEQNTVTPPPQKTESIDASGGLKLTNATKYNVDLNALASDKLPFKLDNDGPQVLIVHTHTTESYSEKNTYTSGDRTTDETKNITAVGNVIENVLKNHGIQTVHDATVHDYPSYNGAYTRALATIKQNLEKYPSIKIVLDVHRDGIVRSDGTRVKVLTEINGEPCAQVMIVAGSDACGLRHENWRDNMKFAAHIQKTANELYPTLMRPINLREERFNTHMTRGSIILEVGSNGNTLEEAKRGAEYAAEAICKALGKS